MKAKHRALVYCAIVFLCLFVLGLAHMWLVRDWNWRFGFLYSNGEKYVYYEEGVLLKFIVDITVADEDKKVVVEYVLDKEDVLKWQGTRYFPDRRVRVYTSEEQLEPRKAANNYVFDVFHGLLVGVDRELTREMYGVVSELSSRFTRDELMFGDISCSAYCMNTVSCYSLKGRLVDKRSMSYTYVCKWKPETNVLLAEDRYASELRGVYLNIENIEILSPAYYVAYEERDGESVCIRSTKAPKSLSDMWER